MSDRRPMLPGTGFWVLLASVVAFLALFGWSASESDFDLVAMAQLRLDAGKNLPLTDREESALESVVSEYPGLAVSLANGRPMALFEDTEAGCLRFPRTHLLVLPSDVPVVVPVGCLLPAGGAVHEVKARSVEWGEVTATCPSGNGSINLELPRSEVAQVVVLDRGGETAWSGENCAIRVGAP